MSEIQLVIAPAAKNDLKEIYLYGLRQWGKPRSEAYLEDLKNTLWSLLNHPHMGTERPELLTGIRSLPLVSHSIFYRTTANAIEIIRILHNRQDPVRHL